MEGPWELPTRSGGSKTQLVCHKLHGVQGSSQRPLSGFAFGLRQGRTGRCLPFESDAQQSSGGLGRPQALHPKCSMRTNSSFVIGLHLSMVQSGKVHPCKPGLWRHPWPNPMRAALINSVSGVTFIRLRRKNQSSSINFFSCLRMLFPSTPSVDLNFCCNHETRIIVPFCAWFRTSLDNE